MMIQTFKLAVAPAVVSGGSATVSFFADTLPMVQWLAATVAIVSGVLGGSWVAYQFYCAWQAHRGKKLVR